MKHHRPPAFHKQTPRICFIEICNARLFTYNDELLQAGTATQLDSIALQNIIPILERASSHLGPSWARISPSLTLQSRIGLCRLRIVQGIHRPIQR